MLLADLIIPGFERKQSILINNNRIAKIASDLAGFSPELRFENAMAFPGLINSHDHLELNVFPRLGNRIYNNYIEWGGDIHAQHRGFIAEINRIPETLRTQWGIYKNLLNGFTTVVNHGKKSDNIPGLIHLFQDCDSLHSVAGEKNWKLALNNPLRRKIPVVMHIGEGTDISSHNEIDELIKWNLLRRDIIAVHGVAMDEDQANDFKGLVWCPASNEFLLQATAAIGQLEAHFPIVFGTDSTLSAPWNAWDHFRIARRLNLATMQQVFEMLTKNPAQLWGLPNKGLLAEGYTADIVVARCHDEKDFLGSFFRLNPEDLLLVMSEGKIRLLDGAIYPSVEKHVQARQFSVVTVNGRLKYVAGELSQLVESIRKHFPEVALPVSPASAMEQGFIF